MSELRIVKLSEMNAIKLGLRNDKLYFKSEADKVIAELKAENERLRGESCKLTDGCLRLKQCRKEKASIADKLRHSNHTRCLAMAEMCEARYDEEDAKVNGCGASWEYISQEMKYWERWRNRWLKIAEQFKEAK